MRVSGPFLDELEELASHVDDADAPADQVLDQVLANYDPSPIIFAVWHDGDGFHAYAIRGAALLGDDGYAPICVPFAIVHCGGEIEAAMLERRLAGLMN